MIPIAWSHIRGNVPPSDQFHVLLARDLESDFRIAFKRVVKVAHALLHDKPTQTGVDRVFSKALADCIRVRAQVRKESSIRRD